MEKLQAKLSSAESANSSLTEKVSEQGAELSRLHQERDELREMTERSSAELRRALEVQCTCLSVCLSVAI